MRPANARPAPAVTAATASTWMRSTARIWSRVRSTPVPHGVQAVAMPLAAASDSTCLCAQAPVSPERLKDCVAATWNKTLTDFKLHDEWTIGDGNCMLWCAHMHVCMLKKLWTVHHEELGDFPSSIPDNVSEWRQRIMKHFADAEVFFNSLKGENADVSLFQLPEAVQAQRGPNETAIQHFVRQHSRNGVWLPTICLHVIADIFSGIQLPPHMVDDEGHPVRVRVFSVPNTHPTHNTMRRHMPLNPAAWKEMAARLTRHASSRRDKSSWKPPCRPLKQDDPSACDGEFDPGWFDLVVQNVAKSHWSRLRVDKPLEPFETLQAVNAARTTWASYRILPVSGAGTQGILTRHARANAHPTQKVLAHCLYMLHAPNACVRAVRIRVCSRACDAA